MKHIRITQDGHGKWYKKGQIFTVKDEYKYEGIGIQIVKEGNGHVPDVVMNGDYEFVE